MLGHRDLHAFHVVAIPQRLEKSVGEAKVHQVLHRFLAEVMVDAENIRICENLSQHRIERARRGEIPAERLFDHHLARRVADTP
ncbi:hypothetical protein D3C83_49880 [compost metagenome]